MAQIDSALEYINELASGAKFSSAKFDVVFKGLKEYALRKGFSDEVLKELVTLWLKIKIPVAKWSSLGCCLIPEGKVSDETVLAVTHWILSNNYLEDKTFKVIAALNWLIGLRELNLMNTAVLDTYYEFFYYFMNNKKLLVPASKLVYSYTRSRDVNRRRVLGLLDLIDKNKSPKQSKCLLVLLGLFKSYRPDCVPEDVPQISAKVVFYKAKTLLMKRLEHAQIRSNVELNQTSENRLAWWTGESTTKNFRNLNVIDILPEVDYLQLGSVIYLYARNSATKKCLEFTSTQDLLVYHWENRITMPVNILSLLVNDAGLYLLLFSDPESQDRLSQTLYDTLYNNFLKTPKRELTLNERTHFLKRISVLQFLLQQGIPVVSRFLGQFVCTWNGFDYLDEILELLEWITFETFGELYDLILEPIRTLLLTNDVMYQCTLLNMLKKMYINIHKMMKSRGRFMFLSRPRPLTDDEYDIDILSSFSDYINELCEKSLNPSPGNSTLMHCFLEIYEVIADLELQCEKPIWSVVPMSLASGIICSYNPYSIDRILGLFLKHQEICATIDRTHGKNIIKKQMTVLRGYCTDYINCLWFGRTITGRHQGLLWDDMPENWVERMDHRVAQCDQLMDIKNHIAFTTFRVENMDNVEKEFWLETVISPNFKNISKFIEIFKS